MAWYNCALLFIGGAQRLVSVTEKLVSIMAAIFLAGSLVLSRFPEKM